MIIGVTNRRICKENFSQRIDKIARSGIDQIILREKDLNADEYLQLARVCAPLCEQYGCRLILHSHFTLLPVLGLESVHMPYELMNRERDELMRLKKQKKIKIGVSVHSADEAEDAQHIGASYLIAGHIYTTDCKKGLQGRGIEFLQDICSHISIPVYAIGGITIEKVNEVITAGASGICMMSEVMCGESLEKYVLKMKEKL